MTTYQTYLPSQPPVYPTSGALPSSTSAGVIAIVLGTPLSVYGYNGTSWDLLTSGAIGTVSSVTGTANQITTSPTSGAVIASIPSDFRPPGTVAIGGAPNGVAALTIISTTKGILPPLVTTAQKNAIIATEGLFLYDLTLHDFQFYNGTAWTSSGGVTGIVGTTNQITASAGSGSVTLTIPSDFRPPGTLALGGSASASALLTITSTTQGFLPPVMTTGQKNAIATPASGLIVYDTTLSDVQFYNGSTWTSSGGVTVIAGTANQITASASSGSVTLSLPSDLRAPGTFSLGGAPAASAQLTMLSTTQGFLPPSMTTAQKNAIVSPASGLVVYDNVLTALQFYNGSTWGAPVGGVSTLTGTANQITASASTGAVTLSVPSDFRPPGTLAIGGAPNAVAALTVTSTTQGFLPPLLTTAQKNAIVPTIGLLLFDTNLGVLQVYNGTAWASATPLPTFFAGSVIYYDGTNYAASGSTFFFDSATSTLGIGTYSVNTGANLYISSSKAYGIMIAGTQTISASSLTAGLVMNGTYQKASGTLSAARVISATASFTADVGATITLATTFYCVPTASTNAGTITELWGLYVTSNGGAGTVSKAGGAYIASSSCGTTTNNYGLQVSGIDTGGSTTGTRYLNYYNGTITADNGTFSAAMYNNVTMTPTTNTRNVYGFLNSPVAAPHSTNAITIACGAYHGLTVTVGSGSVGTAYSCYNANPDAGTKRVALFTESMGWGVTTSASTSITLAMTSLIYNLSSTSARAVTLPNANTLPTGLCWIVKDTGGAASTGPITITPTTSTIDGAATFVIAANYGAAFIYNDGTNYFVG